MTLGMLSLVGAGPGVPELMTVKGLSLLRRADLVLYQSGIRPALLAEAPEGAKRVCVDDPAEAVRLAAAGVQEGRRVCRLLRREPDREPAEVEVRLLADQGIPFTVVPAALAETAIVAGPLTGRCILVTRAKAQAGALEELITDLGGELFAFPVITIADPESWGPLDQAIAAIGRYQWLVITSPNGAEQFGRRLTATGQDVRALAGLKVAAVGTATAKALAAIGLKADVIPSEFRGAALPAALAPHLQPGDRVLMARANLADTAVAQELRALGAEVDDLVAYRTLLEGGDVVALKAALTAGSIHYVTFTSSSTVNNLLKRLGGSDLLAGVRIAVMGPETRKAAEAAGLTVHVQATSVSVEGLVEAIAQDSSFRRRPSP